jgi:deoxyribonuclease-4
MRKVGLHIHQNDTIFEVVERAAELKMPIFQCFFIRGDNRFLDVSDEDIAFFRKHWRPKFKQLYVHATYWINLASLNRNHSLPLLKHQLHLARKLEFTHLVLHPGSATGAKTKAAGINHLAKSLNKMFVEADDVIITLENSAHAALSVGGDPEDFTTLMEKIDQPEKIAFCVDTAHSFSFGYDIRVPTLQQEYIALLDKTIGIENIAVLHVNDINRGPGSHTDRHVPLGEGVIGATALKQFVSHRQLKNIPIILEFPPGVSEGEEKAALLEVKKW